MLGTLLPTFFVVGAAKAGTTSLHSYLAVHPQVAMTTLKEPMCFTGPDWRSRLARYDELFDRSAPVRGESSTAYGCFPWEPDVPDRVRETVPDARIVYLVRDPVARTLTHVAQNAWDRMPVRPFDELVDDLDDPMNMPVWCSRYATQVQRWIERFGADRVLVVDGDELRSDRQVTVQRILAFLGVDPSFVSPAWSAEHNLRVEHRVPRRGVWRLRASGSRAAGTRLLRPVLTRPVPLPRLTAAQRRRLEEVFRPEAQRLRRITGLRLSHWTV